MYEFELQLRYRYINKVSFYRQIRPQYTNINVAHVSTYTARLTLNRKIGTKGRVIYFIQLTINLFEDHWINRLASLK